MTGALLLVSSLSFAQGHGARVNGQLAPITATNSGGAVAAQTTSPGTQQANTNFNIDGAGIIGSGFTIFGGLHVTDSIFMENGHLWGPPMPPPSSLQGTDDTSSGTLPAGTYCAVVTTIDIAFGESLPSAEACATLSAPGKITWTWGESGNAAGGYQFYRGATPGGENVATTDTIDGDQYRTLVDDGTPSFFSSTPPSTNGSHQYYFNNSDLLSGYMRSTVLDLVGHGAGFPTLRIHNASSGGPAIQVDAGGAKVTGGVTLGTGTRPTCASGIRGTLWYVAGGAGVADTVAVCAKDASNAYAWRTIY